MSQDAARPSEATQATATDQAEVRRPLVIVTVARERGITGVHTHVRQLRHFLERTADPAELVTPHSWARGAWLRGIVLVPLFGARVVLERVYGPANVWWYRTSHELFLRRELRRRLRDEGACTVYAQCPVSARAALAARTGSDQRVVLAVHFRISQADEWADKGQIARGRRVYRWIRATEREVLQQVDGLVFVSAWGREAIREWMPQVDDVASIVLPNFIEAPPDLPTTPTTGDLVTVGNLERVKNHEFLLRVLAAARQAGHVYSLDVFGEGVERPRLAALADQLALGDQVHLHGFRTDVQGRLPGYRAYVHASYSESLPLAIIEAMAASLPVLSTRSGGVAELFDDPAEGRFWPLDDPEAAARVLIDLLCSPAELARAGRAARQKFLGHFDVETVAPRLLTFLHAARAEV